ncbi:ATP-dependent zinc protease family protein [Pseudomonas syringae]|uniref:ATP-dependent zinc protease family protein n=1 Tax=Pseudomonas syringae TaxID=317 RepID=UPI003F754CA8
MKLKILSVLCFFLLIPALCISADSKMYGSNEYVSIPEIDLEVPAKLDTGAETASLSARDIKYFKRNGKRWVSFHLAIDANDRQVIRKPLIGIDKILRRAADRGPNDKEMYTERPAIMLSVCMGKTLRKIEVNLTDRSAFEYPFLIGSSALKAFGVAVDPSLKYTVGKPSCDAMAQR